MTRSACSTKSTLRERSTFTCDTNFAGNARRDIEARTRRPVVSPENYKTLQQGRQRELQPPLMDVPTDEE